MLRWLVVLLFAVASAASCKSSTATSGSGDDDDAGDDGGTCAPCLISSVSIACGSVACVDETEYQCSGGGEGVIEVGVCDVVDAGIDSALVTLDSGSTQCTPLCLPGLCGSDGCSGTCSCTGSDVCDTTSQVCMNGCMNQVSDPCVPGSTDIMFCCADDTTCTMNDAGVSKCCAATGVPGVCQTDGDCCGYPQVHCHTSTNECQ